ncbi:hypothetical protein DPMN_140424 [Dreissena polymorpha]|uniref:Uncharacterized protein n=1 Tax=Dreissena polymorpha TaxID=45954 RepID=A0A9D4G7Q1_DREPO|nr:hypothetical protein DPMN_140424 [Dreissena polymorpha]
MRGWYGGLMVVMLIEELEGGAWPVGTNVELEGTCTRETLETGVIRSNLNVPSLQGMI